MEKSNPTGPAEEKAAALCWIVRHPGESDESANERHFLTEQEARDEAQHLTDNGEPATAEQLPAPCITMRCQGCGYWVDEDDEGIIHFESHEQAREYVLGWGYEGTVFEGDELVSCGYDCSGSEDGGTR